MGGLVVKAGLDTLANDDRAVLYGAFQAIADRLSGDDREQALVLWGRRGRRAFESDSVKSATG